MIKYAIVDDHDIFRFGIKSILSEDSELKFVFEAASAEFLFDAAKGEMTLSQGGGKFVFVKDKK